MADGEEDRECTSCDTMIGVPSLANWTPDSSCSTPDLDLGEKVNSFTDNLSETSKCDGFSTVYSSSKLSNEPSTQVSNLKKPGIEAGGIFSMNTNGEVNRNHCSNAVDRKDGNNVECKWMLCDVKVKTASELSEHVWIAHVEPMSSQDVFVCLWEGCKVFDKPSLSHSWLSKHVNAHTGVKPFKCMISGCAMSFSSREGLARHVPSHFNDSKPTKRQKSENDSSHRKIKKKKEKKKLKVIRQGRPPAQVKEDFVDPHAVDCIKEKLPQVMPVSCYRLGIDGANIVFQSKVLGRRTEEKSGDCDVLLRWLPEDILPDEWVPLNEVQKHRTRTVHISQLPNDVAAELDPSFYRRFCHRKHRRK